MKEQDHRKKSLFSKLGLWHRCNGPIRVNMWTIILSKLMHVTMRIPNEQALGVKKAQNLTVEYLRARTITFEYHLTN